MESVDLRQLKSPLKKLVEFFRGSRDKWKAKYFLKRDEGILLANKVRSVEKSREHWKGIAQSAKQQAKQAKAELHEFREELKKKATPDSQQLPLSQPVSLKLRDHEYSIAAIFRAVQLYVTCAVSFHACSRIIACLQDHLPEFPRVPTNNSIQSWVLRLGLFQLTVAKQKANDWVVILDHTCQLGNQKCLVVLGIRLSHWVTLGRPLTFQDMTVLMIRVIERSTGLLVEAQLREVQAEVGRITAILSDQGSDLVNGAKLFSQSPAEEPPIFDVDQVALPGEAKPLVLKDFSHASSHILKGHLEADPRWQEFLTQCGKTQPKVKQTLLGALAPPTQKVKGRYMNIGEIIRWGVKMLGLLAGTRGELPDGISRSLLEEKYGWLEKFAESLDQWHELDKLREESLQVIRVCGYSGHAIDELTAKQSRYRSYTSSQKMADELLELARSQSASIAPGMSYPGSSEIIESLIGKSKQIQGQHSRGGFTKMVLTIGACLSELNEKVVWQSLQDVREINVRQWTKEALGNTLECIRRIALPGTKGASTKNC